MTTNKKIKYFIVGYNGNVISRHKTKESMYQKAEKINRRLSRLNQYPAYHFENEKGDII